MKNSATALLCIALYQYRVQKTEKKPRWFKSGLYILFTDCVRCSAMITHRHRNDDDRRVITTRCAAFTTFAAKTTTSPRPPSRRSPLKLRPPSRRSHRNHDHRHDAHRQYAAAHRQQLHIHRLVQNASTRKVLQYSPGIPFGSSIVE